MCMGIKPPYPMESACQTKIPNQDMDIQIEWKCSQFPMSRETSLDVWDVNSDRTDQCMTLHIIVKTVVQYTVLTISHDMLKQVRIDWISIRQSRTLFAQYLDPVRKDFYRWHIITTSCCLTICIIHLQMARSKVLTAHTQAPGCSIATHLLKSPVMANYVCKSPQCDMHCCEQAASNTFSMIASKVRDGFSTWPGLDMAFHGPCIWIFLVSSYINWNSSMLYCC